jgi:general L-amino acid transport system permease protein
MRRLPRWSNPRTRAALWQALVVITFAAIAIVVANQTQENLRDRGIASGFGYLGRMAGFEIAPGPLTYSSRDSYLRALALGVVNTVRISLAGMVAASALGLAIGIARLSPIWAVSTVARVSVEVLRNTPLLLQLFFWYAVSQMLPLPAAALAPLPGVYVCSRGVYLPALTLQDGFLAIQWPVFAGFDFHGGTAITTECAVLLLALSTHTAAFIGEIVRGGIVNVSGGQTEAAAALGLRPAATLRCVVFPQALRSVIPPLTTQFLNLTKNSSLAVAIGFPDLMSISNTTLNQTGQAIETIAVASLVYLAIGLAIAGLMNIYNRSVAPPGARTVRL